MADVTLPEWQNYLHKFREAVVPDWGHIATSEKLAPSPAWAPLLMGARAGGRALPIAAGGAAALEAMLLNEAREQQDSTKNWQP